MVRVRKMAAYVITTMSFTLCGCVFVCVGIYSRKNHWHVCLVALTDWSDTFWEIKPSNRLWKDVSVHRAFAEESNLEWLDPVKSEMLSISSTFLSWLSKHNFLNNSRAAQNGNMPTHMQALEQLDVCSKVYTCLKQHKTETLERA